MQEGMFDNIIDEMLAEEVDVEQAEVVMASMPSKPISASSLACSAMSVAHDPTGPIMTSHSSG